MAFFLEIFVTRLILNFFFTIYGFFGIFSHVCQGYTLTFLFPFLKLQARGTLPNLSSFHVTLLLQIGITPDLRYWARSKIMVRVNALTKRCMHRSDFFFLFRMEYELLYAQVF